MRKGFHGLFHVQSEKTVNQNRQYLKFVFCKKKFVLCFWLFFFIEKEIEKKCVRVLQIVIHEMESSIC